MRQGLRAIVLTSLALGIGLNILIFCFTSPVLLKPLPYPDVDRLMDVSMAPPGKPESRGVITHPLYVLLRDRTGGAFEAIGAYDGGRATNLAGDAGAPAERLRWPPDFGRWHGGARHQTAPRAAAARGR